MKELMLDALEWQSVDYFYMSFFKAVGAPDWHGKNFDALRDRIAGGQIDQIETAYGVVFKNYGLVSPIVKSESDHFVDLIRELAHNEGVPVEIRVEV